ncbi:MAG: energy transducer TonB, partial [Flavisolibacter sp.]
MEPNKILKSDVLDILFEDRNKEYGAYELRRKYNKRLITALIATALFGAFIVLTSFLANELAPTE